jgi:hypothetical protein
MDTLVVDAKLTEALSKAFLKDCTLFIKAIRHTKKISESNLKKAETAFQNNTIGMANEIILKLKNFDKILSNNLPSDDANERSTTKSFLYFDLVILFNNSIPLKIFSFENLNSKVLINKYVYNIYNSASKLIEQSKKLDAWKEIKDSPLFDIAEKTFNKMKENDINPLEMLTEIMSGNTSEKTDKFTKEAMQDINVDQDAIMQESKKLLATFLAQGMLGSLGTSALTLTEK